MLYSIWRFSHLSVTFKVNNEVTGKTNKQQTHTHTPPNQNETQRVDLLADEGELL